MRDTDKQDDGRIEAVSIQNMSAFGAYGTLGRPVYGTGYQDRAVLSACIVPGRTLTDWMKQATN